MKAGAYVWVLCLLAGCGELDPRDLSPAELDAGQSELQDWRSEVHWDGVFQVVTVGVPYLQRLFVANSLVDYDLSVELDYVSSGSPVVVRDTARLSQLNYFCLSPVPAAPGICPAVVVMMLVEGPPPDGGSDAVTVSATLRPRVLPPTRANRVHFGDTDYEADTNELDSSFYVPRNVYSRAHRGLGNVEVHLTYRYASGGSLIKIESSALITDMYEPLPDYDEGDIFLIHYVPDVPPPDRVGRIQTTVTTSNVP